METRAKLLNDQGLEQNGMSKGVNNMQEYEEMMEKDAEAKGKDERA
jgi:glutathione S-transferase